MIRNVYLCNHVTNYVKIVVFAFSETFGKNWTTFYLIITAYNHPTTLSFEHCVGVLEWRLCEGLTQ